MPSKLKHLVITKVALVDEGSCSAAHIKLYKRKEGGPKTMGLEEILKSLPEDQQKVINAAIAKAKAELPEGAISAEDKQKLEKAKTDAETAKTTAEAEVKKLKDQQTIAGQSEEDILKNANLDTAVKAILERSIAKSKAAEDEVKKLKEQEENATIVAKAKEVTLIPEADTKVVELLKSIKGVDGAVDKAMEILKSANTLIEKGKAFSETGSTGNVGASTVEADAAWAEIEKAADGLVTKGNVSKSKAIEMVIKQKPELYNKYVEALRNE
jgi:hypothetical protein